MNGFKITKNDVNKLTTSLLYDRNSIVVNKETKNVGINKPDPSYNLDISGDLNISGRLLLSSSPGFYGQVLTSTGSGLTWSDISGGGGGGPNYWQDISNVGIGTTNPIYRLDISTANSNAMRVGNTLYVNSSNGHVGVKTSVPSYNLDINGTANINTSVNSPLFIGNLNGNATTVTNGVYTDTNQIITGIKTFSKSLLADICGNSITVTNGVYTVGDQTIGGNKTFSSIIQGSISGNSTTVTNGVYTNTDQTITGIKTFTNPIISDISGNAATVTNGVYTIGNQTIGGTKTFSTTIQGSISGNASTVTNGVYTTTDQTITGIKTFTNPIISDISGNAVTVTNGVYTIGDQSIGGIKNFASNVGIGSFTPSYSLDISTSNSNSMRVGNTLYVNNNINRVGIHTSSPNYNLDVNGTAYVNTSVISPLFIGDISGNASTVTNGVYTVGNQTIGGTKTFTSTIIGDISGNSATVSGGVYIYGNQTIGGIKTFSNPIISDISGNSQTSSTTSLIDISNNTSSPSVQYITFVQNTSGNNKLSVNNQGLVYVPSTNRLGINTTNPLYSLDVSGDTNISGNLNVQGSVTTICSSVVQITDPMIMLGLNNTTNTKAIGFYGQYNNGSTKYSGFVTPAGTDKYVLFSNESSPPNDSSGISTPSADLCVRNMSVNKSTTGTYELDVSGRLKTTTIIDSTSSTGSSNLFLSSTGSGLLWKAIDLSGASAQQVDISSASDNNPYFINFTKGSSSYQKIQVDVSSFVYNPNKNYLGINVPSPSYNLDISTSDLSAARIGSIFNIDASNNRVGVNISSPLYTLDVSGETRIQTNNIRIGYGAGNSYQSNQAIAIGSQAGSLSQSDYSIAIGSQSGTTSQDLYTIAIGYQAGNLSQKMNSIAIGYNAGRSNQSSNCIAIGANAGVSNQPSNSIIINADTSLNTSVSGLYISPIRPTTSSNYPLIYNTSTKEIAYNTTPPTITSTYSITLNTIISSIKLSINQGYYFPFPTSGAGASVPLSSLSSANGGYSPLQYSYIIPSSCTFKAAYGYLQISGTNTVSPSDISASIYLYKISSDISLSTFNPTVISDTSSGDVIISGASTSTPSRATRFNLPTSSTSFNAGDLLFLKVNFSSSLATSINNPNITCSLFFNSS